MMNQLKSVYNSPFKSSYSHPIHTCLATIASNVPSIISRGVGLGAGVPCLMPGGGDQEGGGAKGVPCLIFRGRSGVCTVI